MASNECHSFIFSGLKQLRRNDKERYFIMTAIPLANHLTETELQDKIHTEKDASMRDKYRALLWILQGEKRCEVASRLGVNEATLYHWITRYNADGEEGLTRKPGQGRKRTLTEDKVQMIKAWVTDEDGVWTLKKMSVRLKTEVGVEVTPQAIWYRLKDAEWSWKTGRPTNPNKDEEAIETFKKKA
jgi:transposase